jgi:hypothetical protein
MVLSTVCLSRLLYRIHSKQHPVVYLTYTVKKVSDIPVPSLDVTYHGGED